MEYLIIIGAVLVVAVLLAFAPILLGSLVAPRLTLSLFKRFGKRFAKLLNRISPELDIRLLVRAGNRHFKDAFSRTPGENRILFLPFCLRPPDCPATVDPEVGMRCTADCPGCEVGRITREARELGYGHVFLVPSSRLLKNQGLLPSSQFIKSKIKALAPCAALGIVCGWHLRNRLIPAIKVGRGGITAGDSGESSVIQGVMLDKCNCRNATVDWARVRVLMRQGLGKA